MCNCIKEIPVKVLETLQKNKPESQISDVDFANQAFGFLDGGFTSSKVYLPIQYSISFRKKNGEMSKMQRKEVSMFASFCPFCGEKLETEE
jgi:hypothetical protein